METTQMTKQALGFQKTIFNNSFNAMVLAQEQTEKMLGSYIEKLPWATEESKKSLEVSVEMGTKACADFKKAVDEGYAKFEDMLEKK
jgi:Cft2 family RNA processing exonuclease